MPPSLEYAPSSFASHAPSPIAAAGQITHGANRGSFLMSPKAMFHAAPLTTAIASAIPNAQISVSGAGLAIPVNTSSTAAGPKMIAEATMKLRRVGFVVSWSGDRGRRNRLFLKGFSTGCGGKRGGAGGTNGACASEYVGAAGE